VSMSMSERSIGHQVSDGDALCLFEDLSSPLELSRFALRTCPPTMVGFGYVVPFQLRARRAFGASDFPGRLYRRRPCRGRTSFTVQLDRRSCERSFFTFVAVGRAIDQDKVIQ